MWTPAGNNRYTWTHQPGCADVPDPAPDRPRRLVDPGDGSLIEADGPTVLRYPTAHLDSDGLISNEAGECLVVQNSAWDPRADDEFWGLMEQAADSKHPVWKDARHLGKKPEPVRSRSGKADQEPAPPSTPSE